MAAAKFADFHGMLPGHDLEAADVTSAYLQAELKGIPTFVTLPTHRWPQAWHDAGMINPCCPMEMALYGHPESGGVLGNAL